MRDASLQFLKTLVNTPSPVGHEVRGQRVWLDYISPFAEETFSDAYGNCVAVLNKGGLVVGTVDRIREAPPADAPPADAPPLCRRHEFGLSRRR